VQQQLEAELAVEVDVMVVMFSCDGQVDAWAQHAKLQCDASSLHDCM
jgi:hypothetical protein